MDISSINWLAVLAATVSAFVLGFFWFNPMLFGKAWIRENGFTEENPGGQDMVKIFGLSFLLTLFMAINLAFFIGAEGDLTFGIFAGAMAGIFWVAAGLGILYLFERKSFTLWLINGGYLAVAMTIMGAILGAWH